MSAAIFTATEAFRSLEQQPYMSEQNVASLTKIATLHDNE